jgi:hypothetical protein
MAENAHAWHCEDEEEAHGVELLLRRAGIAVVVRDDGNETWFDVAPQDMTRAAELESRIARHFAKHDDRLRAGKLDARDRLTRHMLYGLAAAIALVLVIF